MENLFWLLNLDFQNFLNFVIMGESKKDYVYDWQFYKNLMLSFKEI